MDFFRGEKMSAATCFLKISIGLFICFSASCLYSADQTYAFKDIKLGSDISEITDDPNFSCEEANSTIADKTCQLRQENEDRETIANLPISSITLHYFADTLTTIIITFEETHFKAVTDAFKQEHGTPGRHAVETYVSQRYHLFEGLVYVWKNNVSTIDAVQYFQNTDESAVLYKFSSYIDKLSG